MKRIFPALLLLSSPAAAHGAAAGSADGVGMTGALLQMFASLAVVVGIIYLLYYVSNRWFRGLGGRRAGGGLIRVVESRFLAPKKSLLIVEVAGEYLLLGSDSEGMRLIKTLDGVIETEEGNVVAADRQSPEAFLKKFDGMLDKALAGVNSLMVADRGSRITPDKVDGESR